MIARGHALGELAQVGSGQELPQLRLPDENHSQELLARRLQIRQEPDLLQDLAAEILRASSMMITVRRPRACASSR